MNDPRGSLWRKWDLHVHTPESLVQEYGTNNEETWERFLTELESLPPEYKVIGINDYIFIDGYKRVLKAKSDGRLKNIDLILPIIELRLDKFGGTDGDLSRINFHVIFSNEINPDIIQEQFLNAIKIGYCLSPPYKDKAIEWDGIVTKSSLEDLGKYIIESVPSEKRSQYGPPLMEGFNNINFSYDRVLDALESSYFKDKYITAIGKTEWADIKWNKQSIAEKKTIINNADLVFISSETIDAFNKAKISLTASNVNDRLLDCSDAHHFVGASSKDRIGKCFTWIKADTTFEGLIHVLNEWESRVYIGDMPNKLKLVKDNKTKYIKGIKIYKKDTSRLDEIWFDNCELFFNYELVAIIGNKGMGKSALTDMLALLGNSSSKDFSFLNKEKFRDPKNNKSLEFEAQIIWESGEELARCLAHDVPEHEVEHVKYIPQKFFETICNENAIEEGSKFDKELKKVIFSHVEESDRLGCNSLDELIEYRTEEIKDIIYSLRSELNDINEKIVKLEVSTSEDYRKELEKLLEAKKQELHTHDGIKPEEITKPIVSPATEGALKELRSRIETLSSDISETNSQLNISVKILASIEKIKSKIENLKRTYDQFITDSNAEFEAIGIKAESVAKFEINELSIKQKQQEYLNKESEFRKSIKSLENEKKEAETQLSSLQSSLDESNKNYQRYLDETRKWTQLRDKIIGTPDQLESIEYYKNKIEESETILLERLILAKEERNCKVEEIFSQIKKLVDIYTDLYKPVQEFIDNHELIDKYKLNFSVSIIQSEFIDDFLFYINQSARGTFHGIQDGREKLKEIIDKYNFNNLSDVVRFLNEIQESIELDKRDDSYSKMNLKSQLKKKFSEQDLYGFLYSLKYLEPRYVLQLGRKELLQLSPGERGVLLLMFYLLVDKDNCPLIIDQPEDNLDNQSVYELIAPCISEARLRRQVFIITHNPNLAVVCDAEQVIAASINKLDREKATYISGAIENPTINKRIIDILEGTKPAFKKRESKYF